MPRPVKHPEEATVTLNLDYYLDLKREVEGKNKKLDLWKEGLSHIEVFISFLYNEEEDLLEKHIDTFNSTYDDAQIIRKDGNIQIDIRPDSE